MSDDRFRKLPPGPGANPERVAMDQRARIRRAVIEIGREVGWDNVSLRAISARAQVSTRDFYRHFPSKEDCLFDLQEVLFRRLARYLVAVTAPHRPPRRRQVAIETSLWAVASDPAPARFALVDALGMGERGITGLWRGEADLAQALCTDLLTEPDLVPVAPFMSEAVVAGATMLIAGRVAAESTGELGAESLAIASWIDRVGEALVGLQRASPISLDAPTEPELIALIERAGRKGERDAILEGIARIAADVGYRELDIDRIRKAAGVPGSAVSRYIDGLADGFLEAIEDRFHRTLDGALLAYACESAICSGWGTWAVTAN